MKRLVTKLALVLGLAELSGCLGVSATLAVLLGTSDDGSSSGGSEALTPPAPVSLEGPYIALETTPSDVAVGDFVPDGVSEGPHLDVAVISQEERSVQVFRGDGTGTLTPFDNVPLSREATIPQKLAKVDFNDRSSVLLVATASTVDSVAWNEAEGKLEARSLTSLALDPDQRDLTVGDFNGDGVPDVAVSSRFVSGIEVFLGSDGPEASYRLQRWAAFSIESPRALVAANFDADTEGRTDLVVLIVDSGRPTLVLLTSDGTGNFEEESRLQEPDLITDSGAALDAHDDSLFEDSDPFPDLIAARQRNVIRVLVRPDEEGRPKLEVHTRPTGATSSRATDVALLQLPRFSPDPFIWDMVSVDVLLKAVVVSRVESDGIEKDRDVPYPLPGPGLAVAVGDFDEDGYSDIVAVTFDPTKLVVLLSDPPNRVPRAAPHFYYPHGAVFGEDLRPILNVETLAFGYAGTGQRDPFLVTADREVVIVFLDDALLVKSVERHTLFDEVIGSVRNFGGLTVFDLDLDGDDDIILDDAGAFFLLENSGGREDEQRFSWSQEKQPGLLFDMKTIPTLPAALKECRCINVNGDFVVVHDEPVECSSDLLPCVRLRRSSVVADLDDDPHPDLVFPVSRDLIGLDYVGVFLNPGAPEGQSDVRFYLTLDDPRHSSVANLNGDDALDLIISPEAGDADGQPRVHVLFGVPGAPGSFFDETMASTPGFIPPVRLEADKEPEFAISDSQTRGPDNLARFIVVSSEETVNVYFNRTVDSANPVLDGPCRVYEGSDPEGLILAKLFPGDDELPDLAIGDEDGGEIVLFEGLSIPPEGCESPWIERERLLIEGRPDAMALFRSSDGRNVLASSTKLRHLEIYRQVNCPHDCSFDRRPQVDVAVPDVVGSPLDVSSMRSQDGGALVAAVVEDLDVRTLLSAVDLVAFPAGLGPRDLANFGSRESRVLTTRLSYDADLSIDGVLLGRFREADDVVDLLIYDSAAGQIFVQGGIRTEESIPMDVPDASVPLGGQLVDWARVETPRLEDFALVATEHEVFLFDPRFTALRSLFSLEGTETVQSLEHAWLGPPDPSLEDLRVLVQIEDMVWVYQADGTEERTPVGRNGTDLFACADLNGDGLEDIVITAGNRLETFLAQPSQGFSAEPVTSIVLDDLTVGSLGLLEANGDGKPDLCVGTAEGTVVTIPGNGRGSFAVDLGREAFAGTNIEAISPIDLDGDGLDELIVAVESPGLVILRHRPVP